MSKTLQIYYHALAGASGGLIGWWIIGSFATQQWDMWLANAFVGAGLGLFISGMIAATDGAVVKRVPQRAARDGAIGAFTGMLVGVLALIIAQQSFLAVQGDFLGRALSWMILGLVIGGGDYVVSRQARRSVYAALGGMLGGLVGGLFYEALTRLFLAQSDNAQVFLSGLGLVIVGACIGGLIPLARQVFSRGELRVLQGEQSGLVREVTDTATIGRYDGNDLYLPDPGVMWRHAVVHSTSQGFEIRVLAESEYDIQVGTAIVRPGQVHTLSHGDHIRVGDALLQFSGRG